MVSSMVNRSTPTVNPYEHVGTALRDLRVQFADDKPHLNALNRAALNVIACKWAIWPDGVQIQSATNAERYYHVTDAGCDCPASGICWHMAALVLLRAIGHVPIVDDFEEDDRGRFVDDDGQLHALLERRMAPVLDAEAKQDAREERALTADATLFRELPLDTDYATYRPHLGRFSSMTEDEINADLY